MPRHMDMHDGPPPPPETYTVEAECSNCDFEGEAEIPRGTKVEDAECPNCGCDCLGMGRKTMDAPVDMEAVEAAEPIELPWTDIRQPPAQHPWRMGGPHEAHPQWFYNTDDSTLRTADIQPPPADCGPFAEAVLRAAGGTIEHHIHPDGRQTLNGREVTASQMDVITSVSASPRARVDILEQTGVIPPYGWESGSPLAHAVRELRRRVQRVAPSIPVLLEYEGTIRVGPRQITEQQMRNINATASMPTAADLDVVLGRGPWSAEPVTGHSHDRPISLPALDPLGPMEARGVGAMQVPPDIMASADRIAAEQGREGGGTEVLSALMDIIDAAIDANPEVGASPSEPDEPTPVNTDPRLGDPDGVPWEDFR